MLTNPQYINQNHTHILKEDSKQDTANSSMCTNDVYNYVYTLCTQFYVHVLCTIPCVHVLYTIMCIYAMYTVPCKCSEHSSMCTNYIHSYMYMFCTKVYLYTFCTHFHGLQVSASAVKLRVQQIGIFKERRLGTRCSPTLAPYAAVGERGTIATSESRRSFAACSPAARPLSLSTVAC